MAPKKRNAHLKQIRALAHQEGVNYVDAKRFAFSVIVEGLSLHSAERCLFWNGIATPSHRQFYRAQEEVIEVLKRMTQESCWKWRQEMKPGSILTLDGSWSHRRNAKRCLVDFIDSSSKKVVDFEVVVKKSARNGGDYTGPSNGMEREALRRLIPRWVEDPRVIGYCHDNDGKTRKTIKDAGWEIEEFLDKNHVMHSFDKAYNNFKRKKLLWGLKEHLRHWMICLIYEDMTLEEKKRYWEVVTLEHVAGCHEHCPPHKAVKPWKHSLDESHVGALKEFLLQTSKYLDKCGRLISTQMNESLHALKAHYANKLFCWGKSWTARVCVAILQLNEPAIWKMKLYEELQLPPLPLELQQRLLQELLNEETVNEQRRVPEYRRRENARRKRQRTANRVSESRCHDYHRHDQGLQVQDDSSEEEILESEEGLVDQAIADVDGSIPDVFDDDPQDAESEETLQVHQGMTACVVA